MNTLLCVVLVLGANAYEDTFASAEKAYNSGDFATAVQMYEQLVSESVVNPVVFFNLGNAYYRMGRIGPAIANYERVLQLNPNFDQARENLAKVVQETPHHLSRPAPADWKQSLLFWHYNVSQQTTNVLALLCWVVFWVLMGIRQWRPVRFTRRGAVVAFVLAMAFGLSAWDKAHPQLLAVANDAVVPVHYGTNENETVRFELNAGDRVLVDKRINGWSRVTTEGGERGWAQDKALSFVGPPYEPPGEPAPPAQEAAFK
jgi:tetratricopeptide (TPR) repeat protein